MRRAIVLALSLAWLLAPRAADAEVTVIDQIPMMAAFGFSGLSDSDCTFGDPNRASARAEDFIVTSAVDINKIVFWGVYGDDTAPSDPETFRILIHANAAGLPGTVITEPMLTISQSLLLQSNNSMYEFVATFAPIHLDPGTYWAEIFETDTSTTLCFNWQAGFLDADSGSDGNAVDLEAAPGASWTLQSGDAQQNQLTIRITGEPSGTPTATPSPTASPTANLTTTATPSLTPSLSPSPSATRSPTATTTTTATPTPTLTTTATTSLTPSPSPSPSATRSPTATTTTTATPTLTTTATTSLTPSPSPSPSATRSPTGTTSPTASPTRTPSTTASPTAATSAGAPPAIPTLSGLNGALLGLVLAAFALGLLARLRAR